MTKNEWLSIGYDKNIIDREECDKVSFESAYHSWFCMKLDRIKNQSCDRIEAAYFRYYKDSPFVRQAVSDMSDAMIVEFLASCILKNGNMNQKEFLRCFQIVNNVLVYCRDLNLGGAQLHDWNRIKRYLPLDSLKTDAKYENAVPAADVSRLFHSVVDLKVYALKQDSCLCLCMNFYLGLRIGELAALTFKDFDFERGVVRIYKTESRFYRRGNEGERIGSAVCHVSEHTKTVNGIRELPILPEVKFFYDRIKAFHEHMGYDSEYLCYDGRDVQFTRSLDTTLRRLCLLCDVSYFNSHMIRKTFATMLHFGGVPTRVISDLMGHSEIRTTENSYILSYGKNYQSIYNYMRGALNYENLEN
ncbi:MAG: site-specific integrase [Lachnoclostridium sp.]|nr:site-specific integrase [Lachnospira sp.]MCM1249423.1 site-specific integrase [Lachnoclostridium sp.]